MIAAGEMLIFQCQSKMTVCISNKILFLTHRCDTVLLEVQNFKSFNPDRFFFPLTGGNILELSMATLLCRDVRASTGFDRHKPWYVWSLFQPQVESCWGTICPQLLWSGKKKLIKELAGKWYVPLSKPTLGLYQPHSTPAPWARIYALQSPAFFKSFLTKISVGTPLQDNEH